MLQNFLSFTILAWFLTMLPGIDTAQVLRSVAVGGKKQAYATLFGIMCGVWVWGIGAAVGISALLIASKTAYTLIKWIGALYLIYLGVRMIWESRKITGATLSKQENEPQNLKKTFYKAFFITFTNPKNGAFYVAILPAFLPNSMPALLGGFILATLHNLCCLVWFTLIIFGASFAKNSLRKPRVIKTVERISGVALIGFGLRLAAEKIK